MSAIGRGFINPFRNRARAVVVVVLLSIVTGFLALMVQASFTSRAQVSGMEGRIRNLIELREAGAFGTGGFGGDKPIGEEHFSMDTLEAVMRIPHARHLARVDEYVYKPDIDPSFKALGASDAGIAMSFLTEAILLCAIGAMAGVVLFLLWGGPLAHLVFGLGIAPFLPAQYATLAGTLALTPRFGPTTLGILVAACLFAAFAGSAWSIWQIMRLSPIEAIRHE